MYTTVRNKDSGVTFRCNDIGNMKESKYFNQAIIKLILTKALNLNKFALKLSLCCPQPIPLNTFTKITIYFCGSKLMK